MAQSKINPLPSGPNYTIPLSNNIPLWAPVLRIELMRTEKNGLLRTRCRYWASEAGWMSTFSSFNRDYTFAHLMRIARIVFHFALHVDVFGALSRPFAWLLPVNSEQIWPHLCASTRASDLRNLAAACHRHSVCRPAVCVLRSPLTQAYAFCARFIRLSPARNSGSKLSLSNFSRAI